jgi:hypothetical protein
VRSCEHDTSGSTKDAEFLDSLSNYQLFKKDPAPAIALIKTPVVSYPRLQSFSFLQC